MSPKLSLSRERGTEALEGAAERLVVTGDPGQHQAALDCGDRILGPTPGLGWRGAALACHGSKRGDPRTSRLSERIGRGRARRTEREDVEQAARASGVVEAEQRPGNGVQPVLDRPVAVEGGEHLAAEVVGERPGDLGRHLLLPAGEAVVEARSLQPGRGRDDRQAGAVIAVATEHLAQPVQQLSV